MSAHEKIVYTIYDCVGEVYSPPFYADTDAAAIRAVMSSCRIEDSDLQQHAEDFTLFSLGRFNASTGELVGFPSMIKVGAVAPIRDKALRTKVVTEPEGDGSAD
jgi:hypothetical protein